MFKVKTKNLFDIIKTISYFTGKDEIVKLCLDSTKFILETSFTAAVLDVQADSKEKFILYFSLSKLDLLKKLNKKQQVENTIFTIDSELNEISYLIESIKVYESFEYESDTNQLETANWKNDYFSFDSIFYSSLYLLSKQKGVEYFLFSDKLILSILERQIAAYQVSEESFKELKSSDKHELTGTGLKAVLKLVEKEEDLQFNPTEAQFSINNCLKIQLPKVKTKNALNFSNWISLKKLFSNVKQDKKLLTIKDTKALLDLIKVSKKVDKLDLCSLLFKENKLTICFYVAKIISTTLTTECLYNSEVPVEFYMRTTDLEAILNQAMATTSFTYISNQFPLYSKSDLNLETFTQLSQVV